MQDAEIALSWALEQASVSKNDGETHGCPTLFRSEQPSLREVVLTKRGKEAVKLLNCNTMSSR